MKAITLHGPGDVRVESVPDPRIVDPTDAVLRITTSAVCGYARNFIAPLMPLVQAGRLQPTRIITHTLPLADAPKGYAIFDRKEDRAIKVMLKP